jgi:hypothetical protein
MQIDQLRKTDLYGVVGKGLIVTKEFIFSDAVFFIMDDDLVLFQLQSLHFSAALFGCPFFPADFVAKPLGMAKKCDEAVESEDRRLHVINYL